MLGFRTVEVYHVQTTETDSLKLLGHFGRRVTVDGLLVVVAFGQADALAVDDIYGGDEFYLHCQLSIIHCQLEKILQNLLPNLATLFRVKLAGVEVVLMH